MKTFSGKQRKSFNCILLRLVYADSWTSSLFLEKSNVPWEDVWTFCPTVAMMCLFSYVPVSFVFLKVMLKPYLLRFVTASVQNIGSQLSVTCLVCLIGDRDGDVPPSLTVNIFIFITGQTGFSVQTGQGGVIHLMVISSRRSFVTNLLTKTNKRFYNHWAHGAHRDFMICSQSWQKLK